MRTNGSDNPEKEFTSTLEEYGNLISQHDDGSGQTLYHEQDALGSTDALLNAATDGVTDRYVYRAFGLATQTGTTNNNYSFVGQKGYRRESEIDLYLLDARYYDYATGKFISEDPLGYQDDINLYRYVKNNPVNGVDPSGEAVLVPLEGLTYMRTCTGSSYGSHPLVTKLQGWLATEFSEVGLQPPAGSGLTLKLGGSGQRYGTAYSKVDFTWNEYNRTGAPASFWEYARQNPTPQSPVTGPGLLRLVSEQEKDFYLKEDDWWTNRSDDIVLSDRNLRLGQRPPAQTNLQVLGVLLEHAGELQSSLGSLALRTLERVGRVALTALLRTFGFSDIDSFFAALDRFAADARMIASALLSRTRQFVGTFLASVGEGLTDFVGSLLQNLKRGLVDWLRLPPALANLSVNSNANDYAQALLEVIGYDWKGIEHIQNSFPNNEPA